MFERMKNIRPHELMRILDFVLDEMVELIGIDETILFLHEGGVSDDDLEYLGFDVSHVLFGE